MRWIKFMLVGVFTFGTGLAAEFETMSASVSKYPELNVSIAQDGDARLSIHYTLKNTIGYNIYVFTPILTYDQQKKKRLPDPGRIYVSWPEDAKGATVRVSKQLWPIPELLEVYAPEVPQLTRLVPGDVLEEDLSIEVPIKIDYPYMSVFSKKKRASLPVQMFVKSIVFVIGYISGAPKELRLEPTTAGTFTIPYGMGITYQKLVERKLDARVSVTE